MATTTWSPAALALLLMGGALLAGCIQENQPQGTLDAALPEPPPDAVNHWSHRQAFNGSGTLLTTLDFWPVNPRIPFTATLAFGIEAGHDGPVFVHALLVWEAAPGTWIPLLGGGVFSVNADQGIGFRMDGTEPVAPVVLADDPTDEGYRHNLPPLSETMAVGPYMNRLGLMAAFDAPEASPAQAWVQASFNAPDLEGFLRVNRSTPFPGTMDFSLLSEGEFEDEAGAQVALGPLEASDVRQARLNFTTHTNTWFVVYGAAPAAQEQGCLGELDVEGTNGLANLSYQVGPSSAQCDFLQDYAAPQGESWTFDVRGRGLSQLGIAHWEYPLR